MPACLGTSGSVRASKMAQSECWPSDVHTFWPLITQRPSRRSALVPSDARSLPASGSLNSWHHTCSPRSIGVRNRSCWSGEPWAMRVGPTMPMATAKAPVATSKRACSSAKMDACTAVPPRPPNVAGQVMPAQPTLGQSGLPRAAHGDVLGEVDVVGRGLGVTLAGLCRQPGAGFSPERRFVWCVPDVH